MSLFLPMLFSALAVAQPVDPSASVDPFIGCADNGHCFAAACVPFGMVQAGADTGNTWWDYCSGYRHADQKIIGFSQTHLSGTGCGDLGDVFFMPGDSGAPQSKCEEVAQPGYYAVTLAESKTRVEAAASAHSAIYRIAVPAEVQPRLFFDLQYGILNWGDRTGVNRVKSCEINFDGDRAVEGTLHVKMWVERRVHFVIRFDRHISGWKDLAKRDAREKGRRFVLFFDSDKKSPLHVKIGLSATSVESARRNLEAEIPHWDFDRTRREARNLWNDLLSVAMAEGTPDQKKIWYTSLYHLFIQPSNIADVGRKPFYSTFSTWDTFRAAGPLYTILTPERAAEFVDSMLIQGRKTGYLPIWTLWGEENQCMIGTHSIPMIVDCFLKNASEKSAGREKYWRDAFAQIKDTLVCRHETRRMEQWDILERYGYYPFDCVPGESVSRTLECAYDDWCASKMAEALGYEDEAVYFANRANGWTNLYDVATGWMRGKDSSGNWRQPFDPRRLGVGSEGGKNDFTEGSSCQYSWHVMQNPELLIAFAGGRAAFAEKLDSLFSDSESPTGKAIDATGLIGQYAHGNEPSHHVAYFYQFVGRPDRTAEIIYEICRRFYRPEPEGLCGNDDCGQMSAWFLFSAMGFYPFNPCGGEYVLGAPQLPKVVLNLPNGKTFTVIAENLSGANRYVDSVTLNGESLTGWKIRHADIIAGGKLVFKMRGKSVLSDGCRSVSSSSKQFVNGKGNASFENVKPIGNK